ncbi:MAG: sigma-54-dependent Fis family transcriptional regulator [Deltaproteobacteria bacterium]|nr:sigma-54-dependent Fis family transcriptional regulator [Deltaproteobacteria bacterium]
MAHETILVADDEVNLRKVLEAMLRREGYEVLLAEDGQEALEILKSSHVDVVLTDLRMPRLDGMGLVRQLVPNGGPPVIVLTAHGTIETAVEALKLGAFHFVTKPYDKTELRNVIGAAVRTAALALQNPAPALDSENGIIGTSEKLRAVFRTIDKVAATPSTVLITGESGTGKELVASAIHKKSPRSDRPFIRINCAAIPRELIEAELFGYERGAFTGAVSSKPGRFELADGGTLFLDEIGDIPVEMQVKLLRALQESEFERVGGISTTRVDVRLVAATNRDLKADISTGRFREDLYYRLAVVPIELPPLRERLDDMPLLVEHFRRKFNQRLNRRIDSVSDEAIDALKRYGWPGNIRELENVMERTVLFAEGEVIGEDELPETIRRDTSTTPESGLTSPPRPIGPLKEIVRQHTETLEKELITRALEETGGNVTRAARKLAISRKALQNKMKELGLRESDGVDRE